MRTLRLLLAPVLASVLLGSTLGPANAGAASPAAVTLNSNLKIHPLLQYGAQTDPTRVVRVIVQQVRAPGLVGNLLGGLLGSSQDTEQFTVIPAVVMSVQLSSLAALANDSNVRYITPDGPVQVIPGLPIVRNLVGNVLDVVGSVLGGGAGQPTGAGNFSASSSKASVGSANLNTTYPFSTGAQAAWAGATGASTTGAGVTVAVLDSGVDLAHADLSGHVVAVNVNQSAKGPNDGFGHGTHVAGIIGGQSASGGYVGIAPRANIVSVKISDDTGGAYESDVLRGLEWVSQHQSTYRIRALNLSISTSVPQSYATSPIDAAVESLWHQGVTVVASAGNLGAAEDAVWYAPGNDPLVISVGCLDENQTRAPGDDSLCMISSRGATEDGFAKPDLVAPGRKIESALASGTNGQPAVLATQFPERISADGRHLRLSGTSMSAPMVTGAVALLLERRPGLTPDQIKRLLVGSASSYPGQVGQAGELNIVAALSASVPLASVQVPVPIVGSPPPAGKTTLLWDGSRWSTTTWDGSRWSNTTWDGSRWSSAPWDSAHWDAAYWDSAHWDGAHWDSAHWDGSRWSSAQWDGSRWSSAQWDGAAFD